jgi:hypothetical protein
VKQNYVRSVESSAECCVSDIIVICTRTKAVQILMRFDILTAEVNIWSPTSTPPILLCDSTE